MAYSACLTRSNQQNRNIIFFISAGGIFFNAGWDTFMPARLGLTELFFLSRHAHVGRSFFFSTSASTPYAGHLNTFYVLSRPCAGYPRQYLYFLLSCMSAVSFQPSHCFSAGISCMPAQLFYLSTYLALVTYFPDLTFVLA